MVDNFMNGTPKNFQKMNGMYPSNPYSLGFKRQPSANGSVMKNHMMKPSPHLPPLNFNKGATP